MEKSILPAFWMINSGTSPTITFSESNNVECSSSLMLAENVIVGDVPQFIVQNAGSIDFSTIKELP